MSAVAWVCNRMGVVERIELTADDRQTGSALACLMRGGVSACFRPADLTSAPRPDALSRETARFLDSMPGGL